MRFSRYVIRLLKDKCGLDLRTARAAEVLTLDIERVTGERLGVNTLKRLLGRLDECEPRETTLNIIASYLGFPDWATVQRLETHRNNSDFGTVFHELRTAVLPAGERVAVYWRVGAAAATA